jgi:hypothetical protein
MINRQSIKLVCRDIKSSARQWRNHSQWSITDAGVTFGWAGDTGTSWIA